MGLWGSITRVDSKIRPQLLFGVSAGLAAGIAILGGARSNAFFPPSPPPVIVSARTIVYVRAGAVTTDSNAAVRAWDAAGGLGREPRRVDVSAGYTRSDEGGLGLFSSWIGREELWAHVADSDGPPHQHAQPLTPNDRALAESAALALLRSDPRLSGIAITVAPNAPARIWPNHRGTIAGLGTLAAWMFGPAALWLGWLELSARARPRRIRAGLCPTCAYHLAGEDVPRCPECGQTLTLHDRSVLAAMVPAPHATPALG